MSGGDGDQNIDAGESVGLDERIRNAGNAGATGISGVLTSPTPGITITQGSSGYPDIPAGGNGTNTTQFQVTADGSLGCGGDVQFHLALTTDQGPFNVNFTVPEEECPNYIVTTENGQTITPGVPTSGATATTAGHASRSRSRCTSTASRTRAPTSSSNGNIQFDSADVSWTNECLPTSIAPMQATFFPYWDDQRTDGTGEGIFTTITGSAPNRVFYIEWRTEYFGIGGTANYEAVFNENDHVLKTIYGTLTNGNTSSTEGVQDNQPGLFKEYGCDGAGGSLSPGLAVIYTPPVPAASAASTATTTSASATSATSATATSATSTATSAAATSATASATSAASTSAAATSAATSAAAASAGPVPRSTRARSQARGCEAEDPGEALLGRQRAQGASPGDRCAGVSSASRRAQARSGAVASRSTWWSAAKHHLNQQAMGTPAPSGRPLFRHSGRPVDCEPDRRRFLIGRLGFYVRTV